MFTNCQRCGKPCQSGVGNPDSRPFRRSSQGLCLNCAITEFFKTTEPLASMFGGILGSNNPEVLLAPHMQKQVGHIMEAGHCDAKLEEVDWQIVVNQWELPFPKKRRTHSSTG